MDRRLRLALFVVALTWVLWSFVTFIVLHGSKFSSPDSDSPWMQPSGTRGAHLSPQHVTSTTTPIQNENVTAGFIHLGKTGGSNLARLIRNGCHSMKLKPCKTDVPNETIVSKLVQDYYHIVIDTANIPASNHSLYIISSRDVYDRFVSAFIYLHPRNKATFKRKMSYDDIVSKGRAYKCFRTLESFADYLGDAPDDFHYPLVDQIVNQDCVNLARAIVAGRVSALEHMYNNYYNMLQWIPADRDIYIVRQEHLWDDWVRVNQMLGHEGSIVLPQERVRRNVTSEQPPPVTKALSLAGVGTLCRALAREYAAYFTLLKRARNIKDEDLYESIDIGQERCPNIDMRSLIT
jgi:hypothetical protein